MVYLWCRVKSAIYTNNLVIIKHEIYLHILEEDADNSPEECTFSSRDKQQLAVKVLFHRCDEWGGAESRGNGARPVE